MKLMDGYTFAKHEAGDGQLTLEEWHGYFIFVAQVGRWCGK
jgi:hypothetical protein